MRKFHVKKGDEVVVLAGTEKGKRGKIIEVQRAKERAIVEGVKMIKRHTRPNPQKNIQGGIVEREASVHISNVAIFCKNCKKPTRLGSQVLADGRRVRICKKCSNAID